MLLSKVLHYSAFGSYTKGESKAVDEATSKHIQFFTTCPEAWGGSEELWAGAARRLATQGYRITAHLSHLDLTHPEVINLIESGVRIDRYRGVPLLWRYRGLGVRWEPALTVARLQATKPKLAVISQGENMDGYRQIFYCQQASIPYVLICQKAMEDNWPMDGDRARLKESFAQAKRVYFVSEHNRVITEECLGRKLPNGEVIHNPFKVDYHTELPWPDLPHGRFRLANVARLWMRDKAQDIILKVLAQEKWRQREIEVNFYGNGHNAIALKELAEMLGVTNVRLCGFSRDVTEIWRQHHALILPSRHEGLPLALVEAMLCGRMAITTNAGGNAEVVDDEQTGFLARAVTVEAVDDAMERAWNRRNEWQKIGLNAARHIRKIIPEDPCAIFTDKLTAIYREVVGSS
jgi:glycosyltransferase involved in cell wall biosynthesis